MLSPQELQGKKFEKAVFGGYDMGQVDDFLDSIIGDYTGLYKESVTLKSKMKVLVDKVEEYRSVDDEIRKMLYTAQSKAKEIIADAERQAQSILANARNTAEGNILDMKASYDTENARLNAMKAETTRYATQMKELLGKNIEIINAYMETPTTEVAAPPKNEEFTRATPDTFEFSLPKDFIVDKPEPQEGNTPIITKTESSHRQHEELKEHHRADPQIADGVEDPDMATKFFEVQLSGKEARSHKRTVEDAEDSDTGKIYGPQGAPKPRFKFDDLRFGAEYNDDKK